MWQKAPAIFFAITVPSIFFAMFLLFLGVWGLLYGDSFLSHNWSREWIQTGTVRQQESFDRSRHKKLRHKSGDLSQLILHLLLCPSRFPSVFLSVFSYVFLYFLLYFCIFFCIYFCVSVFCFVFLTIFLYFLLYFLLYFCISFCTVLLLPSEHSSDCLGQQS